MDQGLTNKAQNTLSGDGRIRDVHLLQDERVVALLDGTSGLAEVPTRSGALLALTDRRVLSFIDAEERHETHVASIDKVQGVSIRAHRRPQKPLVQGVVLILAGILVYLLVGTFSTGIPVNAGITIGAILGGAVALLGVLFIIKYLFWEQGGELVFQTGGLELNFLYNSGKATIDVQQLLHRFFQIQSGTEVRPLYSSTIAIGWSPLFRTEAEDIPASQEPIQAAATTIQSPTTGTVARGRKRHLRPIMRGAFASRRSRHSRIQRLAQIRNGRNGKVRNYRKKLRHPKPLQLRNLSANVRNGARRDGSRSSRRRLVRTKAS